MLRECGCTKLESGILYTDVTRETWKRLPTKSPEREDLGRDESNIRRLQGDPKGPQEKPWGENGEISGMPGEK